MTKRVNVDNKLSDIQHQYLQKIYKLESVYQKEGLNREIKHPIADITEFHTIHSGLEAPGHTTIDLKSKNISLDEADHFLN